MRLPRREMWALLFYLAATPQPVTHNHPCLLFWPDATETAARCNLSRLLSILHTMLPTLNLVIPADGQVSLDHRNIWSDLIIGGLSLSVAVVEANQTGGAMMRHVSHLSSCFLYGSQS